MATSHFTCSIEGCANESYERGWCCKHYQRNRRHGSPLAQVVEPRPPGLTDSGIIQHHLSRAEKIADCMIIGEKDQYPKTVFPDGKIRSLARVILELRAGRKLIRGEMALHSCDEKRCINPGHLRIGSAKDNVHDAIKRGRFRAPRGEQHSKAKVNEEQVREIRCLHSAGWNCADLGRKYGIRTQAAAAIVNRRNWRHVD